MPRTFGVQSSSPPAKKPFVSALIGRRYLNDVPGANLLPLLDGCQIIEVDHGLSHEAPANPFCFDVGVYFLREPFSIILHAHTEERSLKTVSVWTRHAINRDSGEQNDATLLRESATLGGV